MHDVMHTNQLPLSPLYACVWMYVGVTLCVYEREEVAARVDCFSA